MLNILRKRPGFNAYQIIKRVGSGAQAVVFKARERVNNKPVALKIYDIEARPEAEFAREVQFLKKCQDIPGVVRLYGSFIDDRWGVIVTEWCGGGPLSDMRSDQKMHYIADISIFLVETLTLMHAADVVHADLKPENIVRRNVAYRGEHFAICDFGLARPCTPLVVGRCGTLDFLAPELLTLPPIATGAKVDTWMMGIILYECMVGDTPFFDIDTDKTVHNICSNAPDMSCPTLRSVPHLDEFIIETLRKDPAERKYVCDLITHPYLQCLSPALPVLVSPASYANYNSKQDSLSARMDSGFARYATEISDAPDSSVSSDSRTSDLPPRRSADTTEKDPQAVVEDVVRSGH